MKKKTGQIAFGPVPSRRLGQSLGINNIPPKICSYSCIYCQVGQTMAMQIDRREFYEPQEVAKEVRIKIREAEKRQERIDCLTFVPDGEPTLDIHLGEEIALIKRLGLKVAVISNASLIWRDEVKDELKAANWVSLKIDAVIEEKWRKINRAHGCLKLDEILHGIKEFSRAYSGELVTETMLIQGFNDQGSELEKIADFIAELKPQKSYLSIPTRPPAENWVKPATEYHIVMAYQIFEKKSIDAEYLIGYEGNRFAFTGHVEEDLLGITAVHPMREEAVHEFLLKADAGWDVVEKLLSQQKLIEMEYEKHKFYMRKLSH